MSRLPAISGREAVKALGRVGYLPDHQRGSHIVVRQVQAPHRRIAIPDHRALAKGTLREIIRQAGLSPEEFLGLL